MLRWASLDGYVGTKDIALVKKDKETKCAANDRIGYNLRKIGLHRSHWCLDLILGGESHKNILVRRNITRSKEWIEEGKYEDSYEIEVWKAFYQQTIMHSLLQSKFPLDLHLFLYDIKKWKYKSDNT